MRLCIPVAFRPEGGGHYFLEHFARHAQALGHTVLRELGHRHDVLLTSHWMIDAHQILRAIRTSPQARIVQRVDGAARDYGRTGPGDAIQARVNALADLTIFQSQYCRYSTREKHGVIAQDGPVIHNPVDLGVFRPDGERAALPYARRLVCVTWSTNPLKGAARVYGVARAHPELGFVLVGRFPDAPALPNLHATGPLGREPLARVLRSCDALLTFSENEACPNVVLEGLASGLPVLFAPSGATPELVSDCGLPVDEDHFGERVATVLADRPALSARARHRAETHFAPDRQFGAYLAAMEQALARPTRTPPRQRLRQARAMSAVVRHGLSQLAGTLRRAARGLR